ncbi:MAG: hypothetical protein EXR73_07310 [Myxococcales bacterium]|nr:hypothetical protein [Myxococcales bacterium]
MRPLWRALALLGMLGLVAAACGGDPGKAKRSKAPTSQVPALRAPTAGDSALARLPAGADALLEVDLARLRAHALLGPLLARMPTPTSPSPSTTSLPFDLLREADLVVAAVYDLAAPTARTIILVAGDFAANDAVPADGALLLDERTFVFANAADNERVLALRARSASSLASDGGLRAARDTAMPQGAPGAVLRLTARLGHEARIAAAGRLALDELPAWISVWADVADDMALVALLSGDDEKAAKRLATAARHGARLVAKLAPPAWRLGELLVGLRVEERGSVARIVWLVGPARFERWAKAALAGFTGGQGG